MTPVTKVFLASVFGTALLLFGCFIGFDWVYEQARGPEAAIGLVTSINGDEAAATSGFKQIATNFLAVLAVLLGVPVYLMLIAWGEAEGQDRKHAEWSRRYREHARKHRSSGLIERYR